jgi:hypothetical protein
MSDAHDDLRATAEALQQDADQLEALEKEKEGLEPDDPRLAELSHRVEELLKRMATKSTVERALVDELQSRKSG